jgi:hypothetical protein
MVLFGILLVLAQSATPDVSGTWKLNAASSRIEAQVGWPGLIGAGAPDRLHVTQAANGIVVVESEINESHARIYVPGGKSSTPVAQTSTITMTSRWEGRALESEGSLVPPSGDPSVVKERLVLGDDGRTLTVEISTTGPGGTNASTLTYHRTDVILAEMAHALQAPGSHRSPGRSHRRSPRLTRPRGEPSFPPAMAAAALLLHRSIEHQSSAGREASTKAGARDAHTRIRRARPRQQVDASRATVDKRGFGDPQKSHPVPPSLGTSGGSAPSG